MWLMCFQSSNCDKRLLTAALPRDFSRCFRSVQAAQLLEFKFYPAQSIRIITLYVTSMDGAEIKAWFKTTLDRLELSFFQVSSTLGLPAARLCTWVEVS